MLARSPDAILLIDLVRSIDGDQIFTECFLGLPNCGNAVPCPVHDQWATIRTDIAHLLSRTKLSDLATRVNTYGNRLSEHEILSGLKKPENH